MGLVRMNGARIAQVLGGHGQRGVAESKHHVSIRTVVVEQEAAVDGEDALNPAALEALVPGPLEAGRVHMLQEHIDARPVAIDDREQQWLDAMVATRFAHGEPWEGRGATVPLLSERIARCRIDPARLHQACPGRCAGRRP